MNTKDFKTKTEFIQRDNGKVDGIWEIGLDLGYSSVKVFSPNIVASFPSYATRVGYDFSFITTSPDEAILFKDSNGEVWLVGEIAQNTMETGDTSDSESTLYGRERYTSKIFNVIKKVGLGVALLDNEYYKFNGDKIYVQTGLPERYMSDSEDLKDALAGDYKFSLKIGNNAWVDFDFNIDVDNIDVMSQPKGSLFSVCINKNGSFHSDAEKYLTSNLLVFDPGFGTLDLFEIKNGAVGKGETYSDLGMKRVLQETCDAIRENYDVVLSVPAMQKYLETGMVKYLNRKTLSSREYPFGKILEEANRKVCEEAIDRMLSSLNILDFNYMVITGGTGAAWLDIIREKFKDLGTLRILFGNQNDKLSFIYSNVRGYYLYRFNKLGR